MAVGEFDVVLYGATGFIGRQTVAYFGGNAPKGLRWAIAGRDGDKLEALGAGVPILVADARNQADADALAAKTRVILTTAGPFELYGDPVSYHDDAKAAGVRRAQPVPHHVMPRARVSAPSTSVVFTAAGSARPFRSTPTGGRHGR